MTEEFQFTSREGLSNGFSPRDWLLRFSLYTLRKDGAECAQLTFQDRKESYVVIGPDRYVINRFTRSFFRSAAQMLVPGSTEQWAIIESGGWYNKVGSIQHDGAHYALHRAAALRPFRFTQFSTWGTQGFALTGNGLSARYHFDRRGNAARSGFIRNEGLPLPLVCAGLYLIEWSFPGIESN